MIDLSRLDHDCHKGPEDACICDNPEALAEQVLTDILNAVKVGEVGLGLWGLSKVLISVFSKDELLFLERQIKEETRKQVNQF